MRCEDCNELIDVSDVVVGELVTCVSCGLEHEVTNITYKPDNPNPIITFRVYTPEGEDWGE